MTERAQRSCPVCGARDAASRPVVDSDLGRVVACRRCGMLYLEAGSQETDWEQAPDYLDNYVANRERYAALERSAARAALDAAGVEKGVVLEVGLGVGALAEEAGRRGLAYWCVEPYGPMVDAAIEQGFVDPERAIRAPVEKATLPADHFDAVIMLMVLEHLNDPIGALRRCTDALRPGGRLYVEVPNGRWFAARTRARRLLRMGDFMRGHINFFTPSTLERALRTAGLSQVETRVFSNARRGDAQLMTEYYAHSKRALRAIYAMLAALPLDEWTGTASVLSGTARKPSPQDAGEEGSA